MRRQILTVIILTVGLAYGQDGTLTEGSHTSIGPQVQPAPGSPEARFPVMNWYLSLPSPMKGGDQTLAGMGDAAAAQILAFVEARPPFSAAQMQTAMDLVHKAFARPRAIPPENRRPTSALKVLKAFQVTATDQLVKERIAAETNFLNAVPQVVPPLTLSPDAVFGPNPFPPK